MKKMFFVAALCVSSALSAQNNAAVTNDLPAGIRAFLTTHFANVGIGHYEKDQEWNGTEYEVHLDGFEVDFGTNGQWTDIEAKGMAPIPESLIIPEIASYLKSNYAGQKVRGLERKSGRTEVKLDNGLELIFNQRGKFVRIDR